MLSEFTTTVLICAVALLVGSVGSLFLVRVSLGSESEVEELRYRRNVWHVRPEASPDGRFLAFAAMTFSANVWMIEGF